MDGQATGGGDGQTCLFFTYNQILGLDQHRLAVQLQLGGFTTRRSGSFFARPRSSAVRRDWARQAWQQRAVGPVDGFISARQLHGVAWIA